MDGVSTATPQNYLFTDSFQTQYQSAVGLLMYKMLGTRLSFAFSVSVVSRYASNPNLSHWQAVKRIFCYIRDAFFFQLTYRRLLSNLQGYINADWAGNLDFRRSTSGYVFNVGSSAISCSSKQQPIVALSSCKAEYIGQTPATKEAFWLELLLYKLNTPSSKDLPSQNTKVTLTSLGLYSVIFHCNNQGAIALAKYPQENDRSKHIDIHWQYKREKIEDG